MLHHLSPIFPSDLPRDQLWTIKQAAYALNVSVDTARPILADVAIRISKRTVRYFPADVVAKAAELRGQRRIVVGHADEVAALGAVIIDREVA